MLTSFRRSSVLLIALLLMLSFVEPYGTDVAHAEQFDRDWLTTTPIGAAGDAALAIAVQADGKYVVGGWTETGGTNRNFALARYEADGTLDPSFGEGGVAVADFAGDWRTLTDLAIDGSGRIVAVGHTIVDNQFDIIVARFLQSGEPDTSFNEFGSTPGYVTANITESDFAYAVELLPSGKILVAGMTADEGTYSALVLKFDEDGALDGTFADGGVALHQLNLGSVTIRAMIADPQGRIVLTGSVQTEEDFRVVVLRLLANGDLDGTFADGGFFTSLAGQSSAVATTIALQASGRIVVAGATELVIPRNLVLMGLLDNGSLDPTFGSEGVTTTAFGNDDVLGKSLAIDGASRLVLAGDIQRTGSNYDFVLTRYTVNGVLDTSFGDGGHLIQQPGILEDFLDAVVVLPDGRIVAVGGSNRDPNYDFAITRYTPRPQIPVSFLRASVDPNGGSCISGGPRSAPWTSWFLGHMVLPGPTDCTRAGYVFAGWANATTPTVPRTFRLVTDPSSKTVRYYITESVDLIAVWKPLPQAVQEVIVFANFFCGPCTNAWLIHAPSKDSTGYDYALNSTSVSCSSLVIVFDLLACQFVGLTPGSVFTATVTPRNAEGVGPIASVGFTLRKSKFTFRR